MAWKTAIGRLKSATNSFNSSRKGETQQRAGTSKLERKEPRRVPAGGRESKVTRTCGKGKNSLTTE